MKKSRTVGNKLISGQNKIVLSFKQLYVQLLRMNFFLKNSFLMSHPINQMCTINTFLYFVSENLSLFGWQWNYTLCPVGPVWTLVDAKRWSESSCPDTGEAGVFLNNKNL